MVSQKFESGEQSAVDVCNLNQLFWPRDRCKFKIRRKKNLRKLPMQHCGLLAVGH